MNNICPDIVYEIASWLPQEDYLTVRLVFHDIKKDMTHCHLQYIMHLLERNDLKNPILWKHINIPVVRERYEIFLRKKIYSNLLYIDSIYYINASLECLQLQKFN